MFHNLCDFIKDELKELDRKVASGGKLSMNEIEYGDKLAHFKKSILTVDAMENPEEYGYNDDGNYNDNYSRNYSADRMRSYGARGRGSNARRDSRGRYMDNMGGSHMMYRDGDMMDELHELMNSAPNEHIKRKYKEFIADIESMM